jgi:hypothetical protein
MMSGFCRFFVPSFFLLSFKKLVKISRSPAAELRRLYDLTYSTRGRQGQRSSVLGDGLLSIGDAIAAVKDL